MNKHAPQFSDVAETTNIANLLPTKLSFDIFKEKIVIPKNSSQTSTHDSECLFRGLVGHGIQSWYWRVIYQTSRCGVALDIPIKGIYSNIDTDENNDPQVTADLFINACLSSTSQGLFFRNQEAHIYIVMDVNELTFRLFNEKTNAILHEGNEILELLDILDNGHKKQTFGSGIW